MNKCIRKRIALLKIKDEIISSVFNFKIQLTLFKQNHRFHIRLSSSCFILSLIHVYMYTSLLFDPNSSVTSRQVNGLVPGGRVSS